MKRPAAAIERPEAAAIEQLEAAAIKQPQARRARCGRSAAATAVHDDDDACGRMSLTRAVDKRWYEMTEQLMDVEYHQLWLASAAMEGPHGFNGRNVWTKSVWSRSVWTRKTKSNWARRVWTSPTVMPQRGPNFKANSAWAKLQGAKLQWSSSRTLDEMNCKHSIA